MDQPLPLPQGVSDRAVGVTSGAEPELVWVFAIAVALLGCVGLLRARRRAANVAENDERGAAASAGR